MNNALFLRHVALENAHGTLSLQGRKRLPSIAKKIMRVIGDSQSRSAIILYSSLGLCKETGIALGEKLGNNAIPVILDSVYKKIGSTRTLPGTLNGLYDKYPESLIIFILSDHEIVSVLSRMRLIRSYQDFMLKDIIENGKFFNLEQLLENKKGELHFFSEKELKKLAH